ncbi:MAG: toprim domain-containing protein, partial [Patescibacteria group bacterium]|nr:toprim domain-containing protein [Patescibacteria group bacterium]
ELASLKQWANSRRLDTKFLRRAEVFFASANKLASAVSQDRELRDALIDAGLLFLPRRSLERQASGWLPLELLPCDQLFGPRVVFAIRDDRQRLVGFAGRAAEPNQMPKYIYSRGFPKGATLYRMHKVQERIHRSSLQSQSAPKDLHVFLVEGLVDALRLESLDIPAVAVLGSRLIEAQLALLEELGTALERAGQQLIIHVFLDTDLAGRQGAKSAIVSLMRHHPKSMRHVLFDAILPGATDGWPQPSIDPDSYLATQDDRNSSLALLSDACYSAAAFLLAEELGQVHPAALDQAFDRASTIQRQMAFRNIDRLVPAHTWQYLLDRVRIFEAWHPHPRPTAPVEPPIWHRALEQYLRATYPTTEERPIQPLLGVAPTEDAQAQLARAISVAKASTQRRELPVDEGSWDRISATQDVMLLALTERLGSGHSRPREAMLAVKIPKPNGDSRLKALPCPEDLSLQQYVLNDLLRSYASCPRFVDFIPAVRFYRRQHEEPRVVTTGIPTSRKREPWAAGTVSFAYQIEMDVIDGVGPAPREGMFRRYMECWQDFIGFIYSGVQRMTADRFYVARLDIKKFYDRLPRFAVIDALQRPLEQGLQELKTFDQLSSCATLLHVKNATNDWTPDGRSREMVDWLCDQSFGYNYLDPGTGLERATESELRGVPQGPDLSAYLANISLFGLDRAMVDTIESLEHNTSFDEADSTATNREIPAVYARYVDDMVLVTNSPGT